MDSFDLQRLTANTKNALESARLKPFFGLLQPRNADDSLAETHQAADNTAERDSRTLSIFNDLQQQHSIDPFHTLGQMTKTDGIMDALINTTGTRADSLRRIKSGLEPKQFDLGTSLRPTEMGRQVDTVLNAIRHTLVGTPDANWKDLNRLEGWNHEFVTNSLMHTTMTSFREYEILTGGKGLRVPEMVTSLASHDHASLFVKVLQKATSSLDIGMFQFENTSILAETMLAQRRVMEAGGHVNMTLSAPTSIATRNALTMATLREFGRNVANNLRTGAANLPEAKGAFSPIRSTNGSLNNVNLDWFTPGDSHNFGNSEDTFSQIAHYKFIGANLSSSSNWRNAAFLMSTANVTMGALGPVMRDGVYASSLGNIELTQYADYDTIVTRGLDPDSKWRRAAGGSQLQQREAIFKRMVDGARAFSSYMHDPTGTSRLTRSQGAGFFMDGMDMYKEVGKILQQTGDLTGHRMTALINVSTSNGGTSTFDRLLSQMKGFANQGGEITLLMEGMETKNWSNNADFKAYFDKNEGGVMRDLKGTGRDLAAMTEILGLGKNIRLADTFGRFQHAKGFFHQDSGGRMTQIIGSANASDRSAAMDDARRNREGAFMATSDDIPDLHDSYKLIERQYGLGQHSVMAAATTENMMDKNISLYSTPVLARWGLLDSTLKALSGVSDRLNAAGLHAKISKGTGGYSSVASIGARFKGTAVENLVTFEMFHQPGETSVYLPAFQKTIRGVTALTRQDGAYRSSEHIGYEQVIGSAMKLTHEFIAEKVIGEELRSKAIVELNMALSKPPTESQIETRIEEMMSRTSTKYLMKRRGMEFLRDIMGTFEGSDLGRHAYAGKDHQYQVYEKTKDPFDILRPERQAKIAFRNNNYEVDDYSFQDTGKGYQKGRQVGQQYRSQAFRNTTMTTVSEDGREDFTFFTPFGKLWQTSQRLKNVFGSSIWDQATWIEGAKKGTGSLVDSELYYAPMQTQDAFDKMGNLLEDPAIKMYKTMSLLEIGSGVNHDIIRANAAAYDGVFQVREQVVSFQLDAKNHDLRSIEALQKLHEEGTKILSEKIDLGEAEIHSRFGKRKVNLVIDNPAWSFTASGGFSQISRAPELIRSAADPRKYIVNVALKVASPTEGGMRSMTTKGVHLIETGASFAAAVNKSYLMNTDSTEAMKSYMGMGSVSAESFHTIVNKSNIKHGDLLMQTGAGLLMTANPSTSFLQKMWTGIERMGGSDLFLERVMKDFQEKKEGGYTELGEDAHKGNYGSKEMARDLIHNIASSGENAHAKIKKLFESVETDLSNMKGRKALNVGNVKHQAASLMAWYLWEQFHMSSQLEHRMANWDAHVKGPVDTQSNEISVFMHEHKKQIQAGDLDDAQTKKMMDLISKEKFMIPTFAPNAMNTNTTVLSRRPEVKFLTYMNFSENQHQFGIMFDGMNKSQQSQLHLASLFTTGFGEVGGRKQGISAFGTISAAMIASIAELGLESEVGSLAKQLHELHEGTADRILSLQGKWDKIKLVTDVDRRARLEKGFKTGVDSLTKATEVKSLALIKDSSNIAQTLRDKRASGKTVTVGTGDLRTLDTPAFLTALEKAGIGAQTIFLPELNITPQGSGMSVELVGGVKIPMPDFDVMKAMSGSGAGADIVQSFQRVLSIQADEVGLFQDISTAAEQGKKLSITDRAGKQLSYLLDATQKIYDWYSSNLSNDYVSALYGVFKSTGSTVTAVTDMAVPMGMAVYGDSVFNKKVRDTKRFLYDHVRQEYTKRVDKALPGSKDFAKGVDNLFYETVGISDDISKLYMSVADHQQGVYMDNGDFKPISKAEYKKLRRTGQRDTVKNKPVLRSDLVYMDETSLRGALDKHVRSIFKQVTDRYDEGAKNVWVTDENGKLTQKDLDFSTIKEGRLNEAMDTLMEKLSRKLKDDPKGRRKTKGVSDLHIYQTAKSVMADLAITGPGGMLSYGGRAGAPLGSEYAPSLVLNMKEYGMLKDLNKLSDITLSGKDNQSIILTSMTAMAMSLGDWDGDQASFLDVGKYTALKGKKRTREALRERVKKNAALRATGKNVPVGLTQQDINFLKNYSADGIDKQYHTMHQFVADANNGRLLVRSAEKYASVPGLSMAFDKAIADKNTTEQADILYRSQHVIQQVRELYDGSAGYFMDYLAEVKAHEDKTSTNKIKDVSPEARRKMHMDISRTVTDRALSGLTQNVSNPVALNKEHFRFMQEYVGVAGTEIIGKAFNVSYDMMTMTNVLSGLDDDKYRMTYFDGSKKVRNEGGLTKKEKFSWFIKTLAQMPRDAMKPKGISTVAQLGALSKDHGGSGAKAAMANITGAKTASYLHAMISDNMPVDGVLRNLIGDVLDDTLHGDKHESYPDAEKRRQLSHNGMKEAQKRFTLVAAKEFSEYNMDAMLNKKFGKGQKIDLHTLENTIIADDIAMDFRKTLDESKLGTADRFTTFAELKKTMGKNSSMYLGFTEFVHQHATAMFVHEETGVPDLTAKKQGGGRISSLEYKMQKAFQNRLTELFSVDDGDFAVLDRFIEVQGKKKQYLESVREHAGTVGPGGRFSIENNSHFDLSVQSTALMELAGRPHLAQHPKELVVVLESLLERAVADKHTMPALEAAMNAMDPNSGLGTMLSKYAEQRASSDMSEKSLMNAANNSLSDNQRRKLSRQSMVFGVQSGTALTGDHDAPGLEKLLQNFAGIEEGLRRRFEIRSGDPTNFFWNKVEGRLNKAIGSDPHNPRNQSGATTLNVMIGGLGGGLGSALGAAINHQKVRYEDIAEGAAYGIAMNSPQAMTRMLLNNSHDKQLHAAGIMAASMGIGIMAEGVAAAALRIPSRNVWSRTVVGGVASTFAAVLAQKPLERLMGSGATKKAKDLLGDITAGAMSQIDMLTGYMEGLADDLTQVNSLVDQNGSEVYIDGSPGNLANITFADGEDGDLSYTNLRDTVDNSTVNQ